MPLLSDPTSIDWFSLTPELILVATAFIVLLTEPFLPSHRKRLVNPIAFVGTVAALIMVVVLALDGTDRASFGNMFVVDSYALLLKGFFLASGAFVLLISWRYFQEIRTYQGEYYFLLLSAYVGMLLMPSARDLVMVFIALELVSVPGFVMAALRKFDLRSNEGAMKFFIIGVLSITVLLFGLSIIYGFTGTTDLAGVAAVIGRLRNEPLVLASMLFVMVGFGFKISAVPFHFWAPDTYEGSPVPVTAFLSVMSKAAGFAGLLQVCFVAFLPLADVWAPILGVVAAITMLLGNLTALQQTNIVRLLAYSSVSTGGFVLMPFGLVRPDAAAVNAEAFSAVLVYLIVYSVMNIGAFACVVAMTRQHPRRLISDYAGLGQRSPGLAIAFTLFLVSLIGIPPLVGWYGKFVLFAAAGTAIGEGVGAAFAVFLAIAVLVASVVGAFYYLRVARTMWMDEATLDVRLRPGLALAFSFAALSVTAVALGLLPDPIADLAEMSTLVARS